MLLTSYTSRNQLIHSPEENEQGIGLWIKREDEIDEEISGNKWRKLRYSIRRAIDENKSRLVSFGGAYSNHVLAVAKAARLAHLDCLLFIRGEELSSENATLQRVNQYGARLIFLSRSEYKLKEQSERVNQLLKPSDHLIPEGGSDALGLKGCTEILCELDKEFDYIVCAQGTGGTAAGILSSLVHTQRLISIPVLKGDFFLNDIRALLRESGQSNPGDLMSRLDINAEAHCGGYAKWTPKLIEFIQAFYKEYAIPLDPIYTGKMMMGLTEMISSGQIAEGSRVLAIHTGGLQGIRGFEERTGISLPI